MQSAITVPWDPILKEINRILVPGGFAQFAEFIYHHNTGTTSPYRKRIFERSPVRRMEQQFIQVCPFRYKTVDFRRQLGAWARHCSKISLLPICSKLQEIIRIQRSSYSPFQLAYGGHNARRNSLEDKCSPIFLMG